MPLLKKTRPADDNDILVIQKGHPFPVSVEPVFKTVVGAKAQKKYKNNIPETSGPSWKPE